MEIHKYLWPEEIREEYKKIYLDQGEKELAFCIKMPVLFAVVIMLLFGQVP